MLTNKKNYGIMYRLITHRGVAQLVARLLREQEVGRSNRLTPTITKGRASALPFIVLFLRVVLVYLF